MKWDGGDDPAVPALVVTPAGATAEHPDPMLPAAPDDERRAEPETASLPIGRCTALVERRTLKRP
jgi:hypothetical protein